MKRIALAISLAAVLAGGVCVGEPVRVGTYNIRCDADKGTPNEWKKRRGDMTALLKRLDLDVGGLQEVCPWQGAFLRKQMPDYAFTGDPRDSDRKLGEASSVFYKTNRFEFVDGGTFWLSPTPEKPGVKGWGAACPRVCTWVLLKDRRSGRMLCFANTHLDHISEVARREGMRLILQRMKDFSRGAPIALTGDLNCRETEEPAKIASALLNNAVYVSKTPPAGSWRTFTGWKWREREVSCADALARPPEVRNARAGSPDGSAEKRPEEYGARIDYIYVSPKIEVLDCVTHDDARPGKKLYPSDHFPVSATIEL